MGEQPKKHQPQLVRTDFESKTHEQLVAMLESASSAGAQSLHQKLAKAASTITKIGDDLMQYVKDLEWQGDGGDAFRDWAAQTASATLNLGEYALISSRCMQVVSQAIAEAKSAMPDTSETQQARADLKKAHETIAATATSSARHDPDARKLTQTAQSNAEEAEYRIEKIRHEAIQQLRKLAQTYEATGQQVNSMSPPTFSPPARNLEPRAWVMGDEYLHASQLASTSAPDSRAYQAGHAPLQRHSDTVSPAAHTAPVPVVTRDTRVLPTQHVQQSEPVNLGLDTVDTLAPTSAPSSPEPRTPQAGPSRQELPTLGQPPAVATPIGGGGQAPFSVPRAQPPAQIPSAADGHSLRLPRESGIVGGRPVSSGSGRAYNSIGRGTVIGAENTQGRMSMPHALRPGTVERPPSAAKGPSAARRLASEPGGRFGSGHTGSGRPTGRPFTPGGSGLVGTSSNTGDQPRTTATGRTQAPTTSGRSRETDKEQQSPRPGYLVEDEETWVPDSRRALPPVVD
ncbi:hypothetical protein GCM10010512_49190 [Streptomyces thermoviolaceus subsp. thermoviolaceus]|uniref:Translation initiation factor IF-2 n=1 Tax=Streptomyces thermoviolaceus subsp. thermoviolaceus TaxID=66860 RepID=A0ABX0Z0D4_STRTL|nr:hypothetical protein [Streptomyces thermoviolaceus]NJP16864.1 hypothetical protein [Streptomyces thermoviolaceus subsp. thermoviolaceus]WTD47137.1 hypothetical protein OG899_06160 [Streptomyces thermoviolaceus]GHB11926.1 hypothetical protein GCM10010512_49190 [Streptomyces thermoviolaceus subsp. thermoviolaceus]